MYLTRCTYVKFKKYTTLDQIVLSYLYTSTIKGILYNQKLVSASCLIFTLIYLYTKHML